MHKIRALDKMSKIRPRWQYGIFVGVRPASNEIWEATQDRTLAARSVRRLPKEQRWCPDSVRWVRRTLWIRCKADAGADGDLP